MATRNFKITHIAHIVFLVGSSSLGGKTAKRDLTLALGGRGELARGVRGQSPLSLTRLGQPCLSLLIMWRIYIIYINISLCTRVRVAFKEEGRLGAARLHHCWSCPVQCCHSLSPQNWEDPVKRQV